MTLKLAILIVLFSIQTLAYAKKITFTKKSDKFHIETDAEHYALYAKVSSSPTRTVARNGEMITILRSNCKGETLAPSELKGATREDYDGLRRLFLKVTVKDPIASKQPTKEYVYTGVFYEEDAGFLLRKLDHDTIVYGSKLFPSKLARVIISKNLIFFVHYDGYVVIKEENCLRANEQTLIEGIRKIKTEQSKGITSCFHSSEDNGLKKYLKAHPINEEIFEREQVYARKSLPPIEEATSESVDELVEPVKELESLHDFDIPFEK